MTLLEDTDAAAVPEDEATVAATPAVTFADLGLSGQLVDVLAGLGYEEPTPIQRESIPTLMKGSDLLGQAATGTGKTAAFALPILNAIATSGEHSDKPRALVLVPTRELAIQVSEAMHRYGRAFGTRVVPIYGGQPIGRQLHALERGVDVVVATPGRALDHIARKTLRLDQLNVVVLDEADEMLDMGFAEEIDEILQSTPQERQTVLFSATMPPRIDSMARKHLRQPERIEIAREQRPAGEAPRVRQAAYVVPRAHKAAAIGRVIDTESPTAAIIFCRTRDQVDQLCESLNGRGYRSEALHGGLSQEQRDRVMGRLRKHAADLLVATDVAARGLDVDHLTHVINYDVPSAPETYVHRIGRVGRAGREGVAITFAEPREQRMLKTIERVTKQKISLEKLPTIDDLRKRRMEMTKASLKRSLLEDDFAEFKSIIEALSEEFDVTQVALAAAKLAHVASGGDAKFEEIPEFNSDDRGRGRDRDRDRGRRDGPGGQGGRDFNRNRPNDRPRRGSRGGMGRIFVGVGRSSGVRPQDLVGAIAGEAGISGREIGSIDIGERFAVVEVPEREVDNVISALRNTTIKGRKANVRRDREQNER